METPLSTRRITRSLAAAAAAASSAQKSAADSATHFSRSKNTAAGEPRSALHDITNDSPIVGLAAGSLRAAADKTPASTAAKTRTRPRRTPGSGEALLRGQVKALLHKVQGEQGSAALVRPARIQALLGVSRSPAQLLAPTPANTPQLGPVSEARGGLLLPDGSTVMPCVLDAEESLLPKLQAIAASLPPAATEEDLGEGQLKRALVFDDSPGKSGASSGSIVASLSPALQDSSSSDSTMEKPSSPEDDSSSAWSIQVHATSSEEDDDEELGKDTVEELLGGGEYTEEEDSTPKKGDDEQEEWDEDSDDDFDELCEGMSRMSVFDGKEEEKPGLLQQFEGKHTRFIYNSDDEVQREEVADASEARAELEALVLRGLPGTKGRHLRFTEEDED